MSNNKLESIAFLYPRVSHYREEFFEYFSQHYDSDIFVYEQQNESKKNHFHISSIKTKVLKSFLLFSKYRIFNFLPLLNSKYKVIIIIAEMKVLPTWLLLIATRFSKKQVILWGHGISVYNYIQEQKRLNPVRVIYHKLADHVWLYTEKENHIWEGYITESKLTFLNNTVNIEGILEQSNFDKELLKKKYQIKTPVNFIYCARFTIEERRTDLLIEIINNLDSKKYGFIIIGDGPLKPNFAHYENVIDLGAVYDSEKKNELFQLADLYLQPAWIGLSCNEALAYSKPVLTFERSDEICQCVEYGYLNNKNSYIAKNMQDMLNFINELDEDKIALYQSNSKKYAFENLRMEFMVGKAKKSLDQVINMVL